MTSAADWNGRVGEVWAAEWRRSDRSFAGLEPRLEAAILAAAPERPCKTVDIGCGAGTTSLAIAAARPDCTITGLDLSPDLVAAANERGAGSPNFTAQFGDAAVAAAALAPVDLFFSRHGVMFFADPVAAFAALAAAAASGAPFIFSCFADRASNGWATETARAVGEDPQNSDGPGPFAFANPGHVAAILAAAGWRAAAPERVIYRFVAGAGEDPVADAVSFFQRIGPAARALREAPESERPARLAALADLCARHRDGDEVAFPAAAWLWSARLAGSR